MDDALKTAVARFAEFRASWNPGDQICDDCKLTADDLDLILAQLSRPDREGVNPTMRELRPGGGV